ncbi:hypothetical protein QYE76_048997 [Lolium multiflorum]|uniref:DDE Tnp4 domain-containing protein n=1 Tax=Lolium multiflorum TaxID=4521 RepID=A0AAD8SM39_LOLMU|nr:hypothetical protein QYE76_048997 [Lolium multiflorum]
MQGKDPRVSYEINENAYEKPYYLVDGIYPDRATLVKTVRTPNSEKTRRFAKMQEACRKDVEHGFGVLQARWAIVRHPARTWSLKTMHEVITCCMIMHNMIVEDERLMAAMRTTGISKIKGPLPCFAAVQEPQLRCLELEVYCAAQLCSASDEQEPGSDRLSASGTAP